MQAYINNRPTRKIFLYSAHEMNVAYLLNALDVYFPHVPPYGAYVMVELYEKNRTYCVKIYYQDYSGLEPKSLKIPGCQCCCPFKQFVRLLSKNIPRENENCGDDSTILHQYASKRGLYS
ncbi:hypothetical protein ILUMI_17321 [Ignelater luminosus]|uniref:acid phosphatase n=1 Tax=Ignelater luminosus TaxID=2038154 RepID=A0A8K0G557_IGNLU|nr:hypothetical protein ILUMI_17321 [Ignelater luminosus]